MATGPSIDHGAYSTLTEFILLKRNVKSSFSCCISLVWKFQNVVCGFLTKESPLLLCHLIDSSSVLLATPRGQGRGRTVIPGFAVRYISIMLPSQTRHLMCQSQTVVLPSPPRYVMEELSLLLGWLFRASNWLPDSQRRGDNFFLPCLAQSSFSD